MIVNCRFVVIGLSDTSNPYFPPDVIQIIREGRVFSGGKRHHEIMRPYLPAEHTWIDITVPLSDVFEQYNSQFSNHNPQPSIIVFASGDPLFFGFANTLRREMPEAEIKVFPNFNSLQMLAQRLLLPYHDMRIVSLTGRPWQEFDRALIERTPKIGVLTDTKEHTPQRIAQRMLQYGYNSYTVYVGEHLGSDSLERVSKLTLSEVAQRTFDAPNCLILHSEALEQREPDLQCRFGIPDEDFNILEGRPRMITKAPIRLLSLHALELQCKHTFWDVGFCTGSVSIEARLHFPHLQVISFEVRPEGEALMRKNAEKFGAPGITALIGDFLTQDLSALPRPDAVFIGGHGGHLYEMLKRLKDVLLPGGCIVFNSVSAESQQTFKESAAQLGFTLESSLHIALNDYNPIEIMKICL
ncbi:MAG: precorrin-6y C5,15-methyltransferase (decarboxylating) subunit CbiE [Bacteroidaceae bacterium]|nr:precorrin-6y C5,15-methyltransferase (decarboxylating) subunit CbiE [Bacteroidaceae bacterium]